MALAKFGGVIAVIRSASIRATRAFSGKSASDAAVRNASQNIGSSVSAVSCPAIVIDRFKGGAKVAVCKFVPI